MTSAIKVALVAGESSGDMLGALLLEGMKKRWPQLQATGIGGPKMVQQGLQAWWPSEKLAVRGYVEVLRHYCEIVGIRQQLLERLLRDPPDIFIGIDAPDFNLELETQLKARGVKTVHFISPSIWAWRPERIEKIRRACDHVLCIFPFEKAIYDQAGMAATYVGHPLAQHISMHPDRAAARHALKLLPQDTVVAVLPGSRQSEIASIAPLFFRAVAIINKAQPAIKFIVPAVPYLRAQIEVAAQKAGVHGLLTIVTGQSHAVLAACNVTLIASGTATLEAALFKRPMVIGYYMHWLSWQLTRRKQLQPWVGLPNILCQEFVVPEFLQDAATPVALAHSTLGWLQETAKILVLEQRFELLHHSLLRDTPTLACDAIQSVLTC